MHKFGTAIGKRQHVDRHRQHKDRFSAKENKKGNSIVCCVAIGYEPNGLVLESPHTQEIFLFAKTSRPVLGPTKPLIQWVTGLFPVGKAIDWDIDLSPPPSAERS